MSELEQLRARVAELEAEVQDYLVGRRYGGGRQHETGIRSPIDMLRDQTNTIADVLGISKDEWQRGWSIRRELERAWSGERQRELATGRAL